MKVFLLLFETNEDPILPICPHCGGVPAETSLSEAIKAVEAIYFEMTTFQPSAIARELTAFGIKPRIAVYNLPDGDDMYTDGKLIGPEFQEYLKTWLVNPVETGIGFRSPAREIRLGQCGILGVPVRRYIFRSCYIRTEELDVLHEDFMSFATGY